MDREALPEIVRKLWRMRRRKYLRPGTWSLVFTLLMSMIALYPFFENDIPERPSPTLFLMNFVVLVALIWEVSRRPLEILFGLCIGIPALILHWLTVSHTAIALEFALTMLLYTYVMLLIFFRVLSARSISLEHVFGTATLYLLMGLFWTDAYLLIEALGPPAFAMNGEPFHLSWMDTLYFSFTTLTTLGYGDITPITAHARSISILEAITGVLFNALVLGRMIGLYVQTFNSGETKCTKKS